MGDVVTFINGRAYSQEELLSNGKYKVLRVGNFYTNDSWYYSDMELEAKYYAEEGDLLYTWSATFGPHIWHGDKVIYHYHIWKVELSDALEKHFAVQLLEKDKQSILSDKNGSTMVHITKAGMESKEVMLPPNIREQTKIGECFQNLDHLITLHQRKCDQMKELKKYMLTKMFPQNGSKVPEIRFDGFTDDWEQRKLGEIATETYGGGTPKTSNEEFWKGDIPWIQSSDLIDECLFDVRPRKCISQEAVSKSATKLVPQNSIAIVTRVGVGKLAFMPFSYATSQDFLSLSGLKIDPEFTVYALFKMMQSVSNEVQGTSIKGVTKDELLAKKIIFPSCNEQKKIGAYLHNLDHLITLHQHKCNELREIKKYVLKNMFI